MARILSITTSRADVGILAPVWSALAAEPGLDLQVLMTGMHVLDNGSVAYAMLPEGVEAHLGGADLAGEADSAAAAMAEIARFAGETYAKLHPDVVLVVGDRLDMLPAATATLPFNLPIAHLHGGEITEGAVDDRIRHAVTKLSHLHFVASDAAAGRVGAMGEEAWRIHQVGAPSLDGLLIAPVLSQDDFLKDAGLADIEGNLDALRLVTVHPETNARDPLAPLVAVLDALDACPEMTLFTCPNTDPGGAESRRLIHDFVEARPWAGLRDTLGPTVYANALRRAALMIGNSSSGLIEACVFGLPVLNLGERQKGRERGANVIDVPNESAAIAAALKKLGSRPERVTAASPYGDGKAAGRIADVLRALPAIETLLRKWDILPVCGADGEGAEIGSGRRANMYGSSS